MKQLKPIQLFEGYMHIKSVFDNIFQGYDARGYTIEWDIALSRILNLPLCGLIEYTREDDWNEEMGWTEYYDELIIAAVKLSERKYLTIHGIGTSSDIIDYYSQDDRDPNNYYKFKELKDEELLRYTEYGSGDDIPEENLQLLEKQVQLLMKHEPLLLQWKEKVIQYCINNNIDIGLSDDVKNIASAALNGNHKLR